MFPADDPNFGGGKARLRNQNPKSSTSSAAAGRAATVCAERSAYIVNLLQGRQFVGGIPFFDLTAARLAAKEYVDGEAIKNHE
jgi:hypothetical protein